MRDDTLGFCDGLCLAHGTGVSGDNGGFVCSCGTATYSTATNQAYLLPMLEGNARHLSSSSDIVSNDYHGYWLLAFLISSIDSHTGGVVYRQRHSAVVGNALACDVESGAVVYADTDDGQAEGDVDTAG